MAYNSYYLTSEDQNELFACLDDLEYICKESYDWGDNELNREYLSNLVDILQEKVDIIRSIVGKKY